MAIKQLDLATVAELEDKLLNNMKRAMHVSKMKMEHQAGLPHLLFPYLNIDLSSTKTPSEMPVPML